MMNHAELRDFVTILTKESGRIILSHYLNENLKVDYKSDQTPVTIVDQETEKALREMIEKKFPEHGIIGEEYGSIRKDAEYVWLIDPIDGTKSFIYGVPLFGTLICLKKRGVPILGVIHHPVTNQLMIGDELGTTLNGKLVNVSQTKRIENAVLLTTDDKDARNKFGHDKWMELVDKSSVFRTWGDCYGYTMLASGCADIMIDPIVNIWDFHGMIPIVRGAGGIITDWEGKDPTEGDSVIASNPLIHKEVLRCLN